MKGRGEAWAARVASGQARFAPSGLSRRQFLSLPEPVRLATMKAAAAAPGSCGPEIPVSPARGAFAVFSPREVIPGSAGATRRSGFAGRDAIREADVWDRMEAAARKALRRHDPDAPFVPPFSAGQIAVGRHYRDLVERHDAGGMRCSSTEARRGGGDGGGFIDAFVAEGIEIGRLRTRIGTGAAVVVRRVRPSDRGAAARGIITDRMLVDGVCLAGLTLSEIAAKAGWRAKDAKLLARLRTALCAALDRMQGYRLREPQ